MPADEHRPDGDAVRWMRRHVLDNAARYGGRPVRLSVRPGNRDVHVEVVTPSRPAGEIAPGRG